MHQFSKNIFAKFSALSKAASSFFLFFAGGNLVFMVSEQAAAFLSHESVCVLNNSQECRASLLFILCSPAVCSGGQAFGEEY